MAKLEFSLKIKGDLKDLQTLLKKLNEDPIIRNTIAVDCEPHNPDLENYRQEAPVDSEKQLSMLRGLANILGESSDECKEKIYDFLVEHDSTSFNELRESEYAEAFKFLNDLKKSSKIK